MALKVFHTGDLHLGMHYSNRGYPEDIRQQLVEARFLTLENMVEKANNEECYLFVVAGDLFERLRIKEEQILRAAEALSRFNGVCAVLPGNHDYYSQSGFLWENFHKYAKDNTILLQRTEPYCLKEYGADAVLYPAPCDSKHSRENKIGWIFDLQDRPKARWHLGLAHGTLKGFSPDFDQNYFPMKEEQLLLAKLHFWFLGHTHVRIPAGTGFKGGRFAYCGTPEPDGFDCNHDGSAWIVTLYDDGNAEGKAVKTGIYRFRDLKMTVRKGDEMEELMRRLSEEGERLLMGLRLQGTLPRDEYDNRFLWRDRIKEKLFYLEWDDTGLQMEIGRDTIAELFPEGSFPYLLLNRLAENEDKRALQLAYMLMKEVKK